MIRQLSLVVVVSVCLGQLAAPPAGAQVSRRGYSSRGVNSIGTSNPALRNRIVSGAKPSYNQGYGIRAQMPAGLSTMPNAGGLFFDFSTAPAYNNDLLYPGDLGATGEAGMSGESASPSSRPNVRPRIDVTDRDAVKSDFLLEDIRQKVSRAMTSAGQKPFDPEWFAAHPQASAVRVSGGNVWSRPSWDKVRKHLQLKRDAVHYDFLPDRSGLIFVYQDGQRLERAVDARGSSVAAVRTPQASADSSTPLSLGVFALIPPVSEAAGVLLHLAVDSKASLVGNRYDFASDSMTPVHGIVDKVSQRVVWQAGDDIGQTGLADLTGDAARMLMFRADGWTQPWILVRLQKP